MREGWGVGARRSVGEHVPKEGRDPAVVTAMLSNSYKLLPQRLLLKGSTENFVLPTQRVNR